MCVLRKYAKKGAWRGYFCGIIQQKAAYSRPKQKFMEEERQNPTPTAEAPATTQEPAPASTPAPSSEPAPSKRDAFRSRVGSRYKDLDLNDEDAYYDQMSRMMDEYEGYEKSSERMRNAVGKSPAMVELLRAAQEQEDFDPVLWMAENRGLDLEALQNDPEYAKKLATAHSKYMERAAESKKIAEDMEANMPGSVEAVKAKGAELGMSEDDIKSTIGRMYQIMEDLVHGKIDPELFQMLAKGASHDADVAQAHDEGQAQGLSTKIDAQMRRDAGRTPKPSGRQAPVSEPKPKKEFHNPFAHV